MANQRDLLKEAIADAKAVKETAIANAKASLEESFTPHLKELLSAKLQEMEDEDDLDEGYGKKEEVEEGKKEEIEEETLDLDELVEKDIDEAKDQMDEAEEEEEDDSEMEDGDAEMDDEEIDLEDMSEEDLKSFIEDVISDMVQSGELEPGEGAEMEPEEGEMEDEIEMEDDSEEEIMEKEEMEEGQFSGNQSDVPGGGLANIIDMVKKSPEMAKKLMAALKELPAGAGYAMRREGESEELKEAISTINSLKSELQEINLLNAKLLYTNKIFKAKNLTESKKLRVLKSFDKAETVKEAKMVFETLVDSLGSTKKSSMVNEIKSSASKASGITENSNKQPIMENAAFERMKKLAFHNSNI